MIWSFALTSSSKEFLRRCAAISTRDQLTADLVESTGLPRPTMTGCPAWYDTEHLGKPLASPSSPARILLSTPQRDVYGSQAIELALGLRRGFPNARIVTAFNRGWQVDENTGPREARVLARLERQLAIHGFETVDLSNGLRESWSSTPSSTSTSGIGFTRTFSSRAGESHPISSVEDSRALGHCRTLGLTEFMGVSSGTDRRLATSTRTLAVAQGGRSSAQAVSRG